MEIEAEEISLLSLPTRMYNRPVQLNKLKTCVTNFYRIDLKNDVKIYQYMFSCEPEIPADSKNLIEQAYREVRRQIKKELSLITHSGFMMWGYKPINIPFKTAIQF